MKLLLFDVSLPSFFQAFSKLFWKFFHRQVFIIKTFCSEIQAKTQKHLDTLRLTLTLVHMYGTHSEVALQ